MGKKKNRAKKNKENEAEESSDEGPSTCPHIAKAVNFAAMRKALVKPVCRIGECSSCNLGTGKGQRKGKGEDNTAAVVQDGEEDLQTTIWVCLQCGHQGCDRNSQEKHALKHYDAPRNGIHCLVINLTTWVTWCYACDDDVPLESKRIQDCMDFLWKQVKTSAQAHPQSANENSNQNFMQTNNQSDGGSLSSSTATSGQPVVITPQSSGKSSDLVCHKVKGLNNLGNTCFFNAVMQNMCQTPGLEALLGERCRKDFTLSVVGWNDDQKDSDLGSDSEDEEECRVQELSPISVEMGEPGALSMALTNFVREMNIAGGKNTVSPNTLFGNICKKAPRFRGFQQQDSHELLRYLVDAVRNEEIRRAQLGILRHFKVQDQVNSKELDEDVRRNIKGYGLPIKFTFVDSLFGGQLVSTVTCEECSHVSQIIESFLDLSLPVTEEKLQRSNQILGGRNKESLAAAVGKEVEEDSPPLKGVDGFAARSGKPSKYQERKNRKHAKKEAKKKGRGNHTKNQLGLKKNTTTKEEEEEEEINEGEAEAEEEDMEKEKPAGADSEKVDPLTDQALAKSSAPDADIEANADSEAPRLQMMAGDSHDNSSNLAQGSNLQNLEDLSIKVGTQKELHILPKHLESNSYPASSGVEATGIKEGKQCEVEKLANDIRSLTLDNSGLGRTEGGSDETSAEDHGRKEETGSETSFSSPEVCRSVAADQKQACHNGEVDSSRIENECKGPPLTTEDITLCFDNDTAQHNCGDHTASHNSSPYDSEIMCGQKHRGTDKVRTDRYKEARHKSKTTLSTRYQSAPKECSVMSCLNQFTSAEVLTGPNKVKCKACTKARPVEATPQTDKKKTQGVYSIASKQYLILAPPAVLTLHLKRFEQVGFGCRKVNRHVEFPVLLDLAPYCSALCQEVQKGQRQVLYSLYGVVEHSGRLHGGHYTAYVKVRPNLGPVNSFLRSQPLKSHDYIHRLMEQMPNGMDSQETEDNEKPAAQSTVPEGRWFHISDSSVSAVMESRVLSAQAYLLFYERVY